MTEPTPAEIVAALDGTPWHLLAGALHATFAVESLGAGVRFASSVTDAADAVDHHPDIDLRHREVHLVLVSHDVHAVTARDVRLALTIARIAHDDGLQPSDRAPQVTEVAVDALDIARVRPFWRAVLGYGDGGDDGGVSDPRGSGPAVWFQQMDEARRQRNRIHLDVWLPREAVAGRLDAALGAGGTLVSDASAPRFWVLADVEGNEVCLCTPEGRSGPEQAGMLRTGPTG